MLVLTLLLCLLPAALKAQDIESRYPFSATLRQDGATGEDVYKLYWNFDADEEIVYFAVRVRTNGWVGLGISPNGGMVNSDVVIGWVTDDGMAVLQDRYADAQSAPPIDESQDWFLTEGVEEGDYTVLHFWRYWVTCDKRDRDIEVNTARVVFSWNANDPANSGDAGPMYHGTNNRGSTSLNLLGGLTNTPDIPDDTPSFTVSVSNVPIPSDADTTYWCAAIEVPPEIQAEEVYILKISPDLTDHPFPYVHHMVLTLCGTDFNSSLVGPDKGVVCGDIGTNLFQCLDNSVLVGGWAVGGEDFYFPPDVGFPIGGGATDKFFVLEMHYDNPNFDEGVVDSSGLRFFYTTTPPKYKAGAISTGHGVTPTMVIPPGVEDFVIYGFCTARCTQTHIPTEGVKVFANNFHTHLAGEGLELQHIRYNPQCGLEEELEPIDTNLQYDFNYQQTNHLPEEITLLPGDVLVVKCHYNTADRTEPTFGGLSTREEMCLDTLYHYPQTSMSYCLTYADFASFESWYPLLSEEEIASALAINASSPDVLLQFIDFINSIEWNPAKVQGLQEAYETASYLMGCDYRADYPENVPKIDCEYEAPNECTGFQPTPCCAGVPVAAVNILLIVFAVLYSYAV